MCVCVCVCVCATGSVRRANDKPNMTHNGQISKGHCYHYKHNASKSIFSADWAARRLRHKGFIAQTASEFRRDPEETSQHTFFLKLIAFEFKLKQGVHMHFKDALLRFSDGLVWRYVSLIKPISTLLYWDGERGKKT